MGKIVYQSNSAVATVKQASLAKEVFAKDIMVSEETETDAPANPGGLRVIRDFRGHTKKGPGRKNALMGQTVLDMTALAILPVTDLPVVIAELTRLNKELEEAFSESPGDDLLADLT